MSAQQKVREFILKNLLFTDEQSELVNEDSFLEKGIIDSTGILEVISFLEEEYGIIVDDEEMLPENFDSVNNIVKYIDQKM